MENTKPTWASKIVWSGVASGAIGILAAVNLIPAEMEQQVTEAALMIMGVLIPILRVFFTDKKLA